MRSPTALAARSSLSEGAIRRKTAVSERGYIGARTFA